jgi:hypothetical protein
LPTQADISDEAMANRAAQAPAFLAMKSIVAAALGSAWVAAT